MLELILLSALLSGAAVLAHANQKPPQRVSLLALRGNRQNRDSISMDRIFLDKAAREGMYGILLGTLAIERSQNPHIKALAEKMVWESQFITFALASIAQRKGISAASHAARDHAHLARREP